MNSLVERLREDAEISGWNRTMTEAADRIEALEALVGRSLDLLVDLVETNNEFETDWDKAVKIYCRDVAYLPEANQESE